MFPRPTAEPTVASTNPVLDEKLVRMRGSLAERSSSEEGSLMSPIHCAVWLLPVAVRLPSLLLWPSLEVGAQPASLEAVLPVLREQTGYLVVTDLGEISVELAHAPEMRGRCQANHIIGNLEQIGT